MKKKVLLAGLLAGIALFAWGAIAHVALPLGEMGMTELPNEEAVLAAIGSSATEETLYTFSAAAEGQDPMTGPGGLIVYDPVGVTPTMGKELAIQFFTDLALGFLAAIALYFAAGSLRTYTCRVAFVTMLAALPVLSVLMPYWNWYGFSCAFTIGGVIEHVVGFLVMGLIAGALVKSPPLL